jgi:hypothetical protein
MEKFEKHNLLTMLACFLVLINFVAEHYSCASFCTFIKTEFDFNFYRSLIMLFASILSLIGVICIFLKFSIGFKICLLIYIIQTLGIVNGSLYYIISFGVIINWSIAIGESSLEIGLTGIFMCLLLYLAMVKVNIKKHLEKKDSHH